MNVENLLNLFLSFIRQFLKFYPCEENSLST